MNENLKRALAVSEDLVVELESSHSGRDAPFLFLHGEGIELKTKDEIVIALEIERAIKYLRWKLATN